MWYYWPTVNHYVQNNKNIQSSIICIDFDWNRLKYIIKYW